VNPQLNGNMDLVLDDRQRAMLREMGVHVWMPQVDAHEAVVAERSAQVKGGGSRPGDTEQSGLPPRRMAETAPVVVSSFVEDLSDAPLALQDLHWPALSQAAANCQACGLCAGRKNSTLQAPESPVQCDWLVLGDPPDEDEDRLGQPFAEQAGMLLDNMLKAADARRGGSARAGAYLSNVVKCRPPNARLPLAVELQQCAHYLQREIALVQPKLILAMGRFATQLLLHEHPEQAALPLGKQRGMVYRYQGIPVVVTYHPKVLLRASADKAKAWADLCLAMDVLEPTAPYNTGHEIS
jgi:uracil-DNA glycosylase family 4